MLLLPEESIVSEHHEYVRLINCIMGVSKGFSSPKQYNFFFEWFYPNYFEIIKKGFKCFSSDSFVVTSLFELMKELLDTRNNRAKFDASSMTGFLLFKEISSLLLDYFKFVNLYSGFSPKQDKFGEKYFFINCAIDIF